MKRWLLSVVLAILAVIVVVGFSGAAHPAQAGGGGIVDPANPCAFAGYYGTFQYSEAGLTAFFAQHGKTFTGVGSTITVPFSPFFVSGHFIYTRMNVIEKLSNGDYRYTITHLVTGCLARP
jgi:hypothetical protein